jgi:hypothetical protein
VTNTQLYLAIGIPVALNATFLAVAITLLMSHMNSRFDAVNQRFDDMRDLWRAELHRVEDVLDARLKHIEEREKA